MTRPRTFMRHWDRRAPTYDKSMEAMERSLFGDSRAWVSGRAHGRTLEIAIGTGANLAHYASSVQLTGIDFSSVMLDLARARADNLNREVTLDRGDAMALPYADASFDTVLSTFALCCVPDERLAVHEALRVLRPGGQLLLADHVLATALPLRLVQYAADLVTVPWHGEHFTRRPLLLLRELDVTLEETDRISKGIVERVHARKGTSTT
ncbi:MAG: class I SAM-dependent methyltransferase [Ornithinimicrobium sp.]